MDGPFYVDSRAPHTGADATAAAITIVATNKAIVPVAGLPVLGANYFSYVGKAVRIRMFGRSTGAASAGSYTFSFLWGTGADANGTNIVSSPAITLVNSHSNVSWMAEVVIRCRSLGATGTLLGTGYMDWPVAAVLSTNQPIMFPASSPAVATVDLTAANVISPQVLAATSTTNTLLVHDYLFEALN